MILRVLLALGAVLGIALLLRWFARTPPERIAARLRQALLFAGVAVLVVLAATGRLHWLFALLGALIAGAVRFVPVLLKLALKFAPALLGLWQRARGAGGAGRATMTTRWVRAWLEQGTGEMGGEVLAGRFAGRTLESLERADLLALLEECRDDAESAGLLAAYLDRRFGPGWRGAAGGRESPSSPAGPMGRDEAYAVLGLEPGASREAVIAAHRRLIQRLHPDRGGSDYLAARINQAKDRLVGD